MSTPSYPIAFTIYVAALAAALGAVVAGTFDLQELSHAPLALFVLASMALVAERANLSYYDGNARWGLSFIEAVLLPAFVVLPFAQVVVVAAAAVGLSRIGNWKSTPLREIFNVAQYGCAAALAASVWHEVSSGAGFTPRNAAVASLAVCIFAVASNQLVALGFHLAKRGSFVDFVRSVAPTFALNLLGNIVLGLFFAAAYSAGQWTIVLFPIPLIALFVSFKVIARSAMERQRVEKLHAASRALASQPRTGDALVAFLGNVAEMASAKRVGVLTPSRSGPQWSAVDDGNVTDLLNPLFRDEVTGLIYEMKRKRTAMGVSDELIVSMWNGTPEETIAVPLFEDDAVVGLLAVSGRVGADEFGQAEVSLLQALGNELMLALQSRKLFDSVIEERERFHLLVEALQDYAIYMIDTEGCVVSWNSGAARLLGYDAAEIVGAHSSVFFPPQHSRDWENELARAVAMGPQEIEGYRIRKDGSQFLSNRVIAPIRDSSGNLRGFAVVTRDITEKVKALEEKQALEAQLHQAQRLESVGQLAGGIAHDFNNLLSVIMNCAQFALEDLDEGPVREDVEEIKAASERAAALTRQLLVFSRRDAVEPKVLDINDVISNLKKLLFRAVGEDVILELDLDPLINDVFVDPGQIEQVLMNLSVNARDAMTGGGTLRFQTTNVIVDSKMAKRYLELAPGEYVVLRVTDTGTGMTPEVLSKAFDPFFTTKPEGQGTGLGLATVYGIVRGAGGHIDVHTQEGQGTTFEIYLPKTDSSRSESLVAGVPQTPRKLDQETILLVEDEDSVRSIARRILTGEGYRVIEARDAIEALDRAQEEGADIGLLLSDVVMPGGSGVDLVERLTAWNPRLKVIYMSGYNQQVFSSDLAREGIPLIQKPFAQGDLLEKVRDVLES
jgi:PAS domain S-box-containing protein